MSPLEQAKAIYFARCDEVSRLAERFEEDEVIDLVARAIMAERERCAAIAEHEALAMDLQRGELLTYGSIGGRPISSKVARQASMERRVLIEGYQQLADAIRGQS